MVKSKSDKILKLLEQEKKEINEAIEELFVRFNRTQQAINEIRGQSESNEVAWTYKAVECIKGHEQFIQTSDILDCMFGSDIFTKQPLRRRNYLVALSVALNKLSKNGKIIKHPVQGVQGHFYGLPEWAINGVPKKQYMNKIEKRLQSKYAIV